MLCYGKTVVVIHSIMSNSLWPHGLQHARLPCPSLSPRVDSTPCSLIRGCHPTISSSVSHLILCRPLLLLPSIFPSIRLFSNESALHIKWPKYWSINFSIRPSNEISGSVFFRIDWLHPHTKSEVKKIIKLGSPEPAELKDREHGGRIPPWRAQGATSLHSKWGQAALCYVSFSNIFFTSKTHCRGVKTSGTSYKNRLHNSDIES